MRRNFSELEQRLVVLLKKNSRMSIMDIAKELGVSRITARKAMGSLTESGRIKRFTINLDEEERDMVLVHANNISGIPDNIIVERFKLIDNSYIVVLYYEDLMKVKDAQIERVEIALSREINENLTRVEGIHCDYCQSEIKGKPIMIKLSGKTYYVCCPACERDMKKRREILIDRSQ